MNKMAVSYLAVFAVILFSAVIFLSSVVNFYHLQVKNETSINIAWLRIEKNYQRRASLISDLLTLIINSKFDENKKLNENNLLSELTTIINNIVSLHTTSDSNKQPNRSEKQSFIEQHIENQASISKQLNTILTADTFQYELKSSLPLSLLLDEIYTIEDIINLNRSSYQKALEQYNIGLRRFPSSEIGRLQVLSEKISFDQE